MPLSSTYRMVASDGATPLDNTVTVSAGQRISFNEAVDDGQTDLQVAANFAFAKVKAVCLVCDQDMTLETNNSGTPTQTFTMKAGVPMWWTENMPVACPFTANVTNFFLTNASGANGTLKGYIDVDPT